MKSLILILILVNSLIAYDPAYDVVDEPESSLVQVDSTIETTVQITQDTITSVASLARDVNDGASRSLFVTGYVADKCEVKCPPIVPLLDDKYFTKLNYYDYKTNIMQCSVVVDEGNLEIPALKVVETKQFIQDECKKEMLNIIDNVEYKLPDSILDKGAIANAIDLDEQFKLIQKTIKADLNPNFDSDIKALDIADILDAITVFNPEIINLQETYSLGKLIVQDGYFTSYNSPVGIEQDRARRLYMKELSTKLSNKTGAPKVFQDSRIEDDIAAYNNNMDNLVNSKFLMIINFLIENSYLLTNTLFYYLFMGASAFYIMLFSIKKFKEQRPDGGSIVTPTEIASMFLVLTAFSLSLKSSEYKIFNELDEKSFKIEHNRAQNFLAIVSMEFNEIADTLTEAAFKNYIDTIGATSSFSADKIKRIAKENEVLKLTRKKILSVDNQCLEIYEIQEFKRELFGTYFKTEDTFIQNPFVDEPFLIEYWSNKFPAHNQKSIYNNLTNNGFIKNAKLLKTTGLSLNQCFKNHKLLFSNDALFAQNEIKIEAFNDVEHQNMLAAKKRILAEGLWNTYYTWGYLSMPFLSLAEFEIEFDSILQEKSEQYTRLMDEKKPEDIIGLAAENSILVLLTSDQIYKPLLHSAEMITSWIPFGGGIANALAIVGSVIGADILDSLLPLIKSLVFAILGIAIYATLYMAKLAVFWLLPFTIIYFFASNSLEKVAEVLTKILGVFLKTIIFTVVLFVSIWGLDFIHQYLMLMIDSIFDFINSSGTTTSHIFASVIKGGFKLLATIIEVVFTWSILKSFPSYILELFNVKANDISSSMTDQISHQLEHKLK